MEKKLARMMLDALDESTKWQPLDLGDKSLEYVCPICGADVHEFCSNRDRDGLKIEKHTRGSFGEVENG